MSKRKLDLPEMVQEERAMIAEFLALPNHTGKAPGQPTRLEHEEDFLTRLTMHQAMMKIVYEENYLSPKRIKTFN